MFLPARADMLALLGLMMAIEMAMLVGLPALLMWVADRFFGRRAAIAVGLAATALVVYLIIHTYRVCSMPPVMMPSGGSTGEAAHFNCDGFGGFLAYFFIWCSGPVEVALLLGLTAYHYVKFRRHQ
jgi:hypothetical protein